MRRCKCRCGSELLPARQCTDWFEKKGYFDVDHMARHGMAKAAKIKDKERKDKNIAFKNKVQQSDIKPRIKAAKKWCHMYIRLRDKGKPCICCGRELGAKYDAGHFLESGNNPRIRYHEDNIHAQSVYCNQYQGGNSDDYEGRLRKKIGNDRVDYLKANKGGTIKRTVDDYREIEEYFKAKYKAMEKELAPCE